MSRSDTKTATTLRSASVVSPIIACSRKGRDYVNTRNGLQGFVKLSVHNHDGIKIGLELTEDNSTYEFSVQATTRLCTALTVEVHLLYARTTSCTPRADYGDSIGHICTKASPGSERQPSTK